MANWQRTATYAYHSLVLTMNHEQKALFGFELDRTYKLFKMTYVSRNSVYLPCLQSLHRRHNL